MQRSKRRVKRQRNENRQSLQWSMYHNSIADCGQDLEYNEPSLAQSSPMPHSRVSSEASTSTVGPKVPQPSSTADGDDVSFWNQYQRQVYIGNSHCPVDGWFQACRYG
jgi:hypothetical protein